MDFIESLYGRPNTVKTQKSLFKRWVAPFVKYPKTWNDRDMISLVQVWEDTYCLKPNTLRALVHLTAKYVKWAGGQEIDTRKAIYLITKSKQKEKIKALDKNTAKRVISYLKSTGKTVAYTASMLAFYAGLRKGEVFGLEWDDIDLLNNTLFIHRSYNGPTKSGLSRYVPICDELGEFLLDNTVAGRYNCRLLPVFSEPGPTIRGACRAVEAPEITLHGFRHSFATAALNAGVNMKEVQEMLGHSSLSTTTDIYWHLLTIKNINMGFLK